MQGVADQRVQLQHRQRRGLQARFEYLDDEGLVHHGPPLEAQHLRDNVYQVGAAQEQRQREPDADRKLAQVRVGREDEEGEDDEDEADGRHQPQVNHGDLVPAIDVEVPCYPQRHRQLQQVREEARAHAECGQLRSRLAVRNEHLRCLPVVNKRGPPPTEGGHGRGVVPKARQDQRQHDVEGVMVACGQRTHRRDQNGRDREQAHRRARLPVLRPLAAEHLDNAQAKKQQHERPAREDHVSAIPHALGLRLHDVDHRAPEGRAPIDVHVPHLLESIGPGTVIRQALLARLPSLRVRHHRGHVANGAQHVQHHEADAEFGPHVHVPLD
mmetsp:Transcript_87267/g.267099  ORF Transcript_87267/g.267099 Transcript_87267/m.267099 type:complete len:327 (-) Transcript_87267:739-1719(-)